MGVGCFSYSYCCRVGLLTYSPCLVLPHCLGCCSNIMRSSLTSTLAYSRIYRPLISRTCCNLVISRLMASNLPLVLCLTSQRLFSGCASLSPDAKCSPGMGGGLSRCFGLRAGSLGRIPRHNVWRKERKGLSRSRFKLIGQYTTVLVTV